MRKLNLLIAGLFYLFITNLFAQESPLPMIIEINQHVIATLKVHQPDLKQHPNYIREAINQYFMPHVDTLGMSRSVLGRVAWQQASNQEKNQFTSEFTNLVLRTYAQPLANYSGEKVEFLPLKPSNTPRFSQVQTIIVRPNGQRIPMTYHLVLNGQNQWKIYDLSVEGISLLNSFRNQFGDALKQDGLKNIIQALHQKNQKYVS
jgi:phospholipid transport system substrate-binding protein